MDMPIPEINSVLGALCGGGFVFMIARHFVIKTLEDIDAMANHLHSIKVQISAIDAQLHKISKMEDMLIEHDRKIIELHALRYKSQSSSSGLRPTH